MTQKWDCGTRVRVKRRVSRVRVAATASPIVPTETSAATLACVSVILLLLHTHLTAFVQDYPGKPVPER